MQHITDRHFWQYVLWYPFVPIWFLMTKNISSMGNVTDIDIVKIVAFQWYLIPFLTCYTVNQKVNNRLINFILAYLPTDTCKPGACIHQNPFICCCRRTTKVWLICSFFSWQPGNPYPGYACHSLGTSGLGECFRSTSYVFEWHH